MPSAKLSDNCRAGGCAASSWPGLEQFLPHLLDDVWVIPIHPKDAQASTLRNLLLPSVQPQLVTRGRVRVWVHLDQQVEGRQVEIKGLPAKLR